MAPSDQLTDSELTELLKCSDDSAFTAIYKRYWSALYQSAYAILQDTDTAQDIVQNVFISLWHRRSEADIRILKPYLYQATRFLVFKTIRHRKSDQYFCEQLKAISSEIIADDPLLFKEQQELLRKLLSDLPEDCQETFRLSREEGLTYKKIASHLQISEKTVEKRLSRSLKHLRRGLNWEMCLAILSGTTITGIFV
jgi:RNA polymerase sigma-70 factor (ECF subfamily)